MSVATSTRRFVETRTKGWIDAARTRAGDSGAGVQQAVSNIATYIPSEIVALYVAVIALVSEHDRVPGTLEWVIFGCFLIGTPTAVWLLCAAMYRKRTGQLPLTPSQWPLWEMFASVVAYGAWAFALPNSPFSTLAFYDRPVSGVVLLVTSTILGLVAPVFRPLDQQ